MLFDLFIGALETVCDVIEYGPVDAVRINSSISPEAERSYRRVMDSISSEYSSSEYSKLKELEDRLESVDYQANDKISGSKNTEFIKDVEACLEESEEEMINKAISEKSCW